MSRTRLIATAAALAVFAALSGCATTDAGTGATGPYAGRHDHNRDAKQGAAPVYAPSTPAPRKSLRPAW